MKKIFCFAVLLATSIVILAQDKTVSKSFFNIKTVRLSAASGNVELVRSSGKDIKVTVRHSYDERDYHVIMEENAGRLTLKEDFSRGNYSGSSNWKLEIPDNITLNITSGSGDLIITEVTSDIKSSIGSGDIEMSGVKGELNLNTGSGNITMDKTEGEVSLNTGSGNIRAQNGSGSLSFNAGSGSIRLTDMQGDFSVNAGSGNIQAKGITLNGSSSFNTGSGKVDVVLAKSLDYNISVNSGSGDATLDFNGNAISGEVIMTANKRTGNVIAPFKFDSEETIEQGHGNTRVVKTAKIGTKDIRIKVGTGSGTAEIKK